MGEKTSNERSFEKDLQALWSAEKMLTEKMPEMIKRATNLGLQKGLALHLAETNQQMVALQTICKLLGYKHEGTENEEMKKLLSTANEIMAANGDSGNVDQVIIAHAIKVEHYEIERYTSVADTAEAMGYEGIAMRLRLTLEEERQADTKLNFLNKMYVEKSAEIGEKDLALK